jgi:hypothetical protein
LSLGQSDAALARVGDWLEDPFAFREARGSPAFGFGSEAALVAIAEAVDVGFWLLPADLP